MGILPQKLPPPDSQIAQDLLEQTEMIFQDVRKNAMQAYIKYIAYYDKKPNVSKRNEQQYVYVPQPNADHQGSKNPRLSMDRPYFKEMALPNSNYLVRKLGTNKTQVLHCMRLRLYADNPYPTYKEHHKNGGLTLKIS